MHAFNRLYDWFTVFGSSRNHLVIKLATNSIITRLPLRYPCSTASGIFFNHFDWFTVFGSSRNHLVIKLATNSIITRLPLRYPCSTASGIFFKLDIKCILCLEIFTPIEFTLVALKLCRHNIILHCYIYWARGTLITQGYCAWEDCEPGKWVKAWPIGTSCAQKRSIDIRLLSCARWKSAIYTSFKASTKYNSLVPWRFYKCIIQIPF